MDFAELENLNSCALLATADPALRLSRAALLRRFGLNTTASVSMADALMFLM